MACGQNINQFEGRVFGRLTVLSFAYSNGPSHWMCKCECGNERIVRSDSLVRGTIVSCGCFSRERTSARATTHGLSKSREYAAWLNMRRRCYNPKNRQYKDWGGRGITVCDKWRHSFDSFFEDMGRRPSKKHSLHRVDNDKGYYKENCQWAIKPVQDRARRSNVWIEYEGRTMILKDWARFLGVTEGAIKWHFRQGKSYCDALKFISDKHSPEN